MHDSGCNLCKWLVKLLGVIAIGGAAIALADPPEAAPAGGGTAPCGDAPYRAFDFWVGTWQVTGPRGEMAGRNVIEAREGGCVLVEHWHGVQGGSGMSVNFYDPAAGQWRQVWTSPQSQIDIRGNLEGGSMRLEGTIVYLQDGTSKPFRGTWTALPDGRVRQVFEESDGIDWKPWFEGFYAHLEDAGPAP